VLQTIAFELARASQRRRSSPSSSSDLKGTAALIAYTGIVAVPVLVALNPKWLRQWTVPMLAVTSMGVYATVPDTEHVQTVMLVMVPIGAACALLRLKVPGIISAGAAAVILWQAYYDVAGQAPPVVRAIGCFAALLAMPVAALLARLTDRGRPATLLVLVTHGAVAVFASRALVHQRSLPLVAFVIGTVLVGAVAVLYLFSRPFEEDW